MTLYGVNYFVFERQLFINELLSLLGFIVFLRFTLRNNWKVRIPDNPAYRYVLWFLLLGAGHAVVGLFIRTNWYFYFRNLSIIYSVFVFFLGFYLYHQQYAFYQRFRRAIYGYGLFAMVVGKLGFIDRNAFAYWIVLLQRRWKLVGLIFLSAFMLFYFLRFTSLTVLIILAALIAIVFIQRYWRFKALVIASSIALLLLFVWAAPYLKLYSVNTKLFFGDVAYVYSKHSFFQIDHNTSWRMIFWYRLIVEAFPTNLIGVGIGTPLLPYLPNVTTTDLLFDDEYIAHVIGAHNSFITLFARFGILSLVLFLLIYRFIFKEFFTYKKYYLNHQSDFSYFLAFFVITLVAQFNLVIESVTLSGLYWFSLGTVSAATHHRVRQSINVSTQHHEEA